MHLLNSFAAAATIILFFFEIQRTCANPISDAAHGRFLFFRLKSTVAPLLTPVPTEFLVPLGDTATALIDETRGNPIAATSVTPNPNSITTSEASPISKETNGIENNTTIAGTSEVTTASLSTTNGVIANNETVSSTLPTETVPSSTAHKVATANNPRGTVSVNGTTVFIATDNVTTATTIAPKKVSLLGRKDVNHNSSETTTANYTSTATESTSAATGENATTAIHRNYFEHFKASAQNEVNAFAEKIKAAAQAAAGLFSSGVTGRNKSQTEISVEDTTQTTPTTKSDATLLSRSANETTTENSIATVTPLVTVNGTTDKTELMVNATTTAVTSESTTAGTSELTTAVTSESTTAVTSESTTAVTSELTTAVTSELTTAATSESTTALSSTNETTTKDIDSLSTTTTGQTFVTKNASLITKSLTTSTERYSAMILDILNDKLSSESDETDD